MDRNTFFAGFFLGMVAGAVLSVAAYVALESASTRVVDAPPEIHIKSLRLVGVDYDAGMTPRLILEVER